LEVIWKGVGNIGATYLDRAEPLVLSALDELGYSLVEMSEKFARGDYLVSIVVWKPDGIGIADCVKITKKLHPMLEQDPVIPDYVRLEVSSPGIDRKLRNLQEMNIFKGLEITLNLDTHKPVTGKCMGIDGEFAVLDVDGNELRYPLASITSARLAG
jgi:ribosome maturation factor RimP